MNLYAVRCWKDDCGGIGCSMTFYNVIVLANNEEEAKALAVSDGNELNHWDKVVIIDLDKIGRMKKPRVLY